MKKEKITFVATKVMNKPIKISFFDKKGRRVTFNGIRTFENKMKKILEKDIQKSILDYLRMNGFMAWKSVSTGIAGGGKDKTRFYSMGQKGLSDIIALKDGATIFIEVKTDKGVLTDNQKKFLEDVRRKGAIGIVARSIDDVAKVLEDNLLVKL